MFTGLQYTKQLSEKWSHVAYSKQNQREPMLPHPIPTRPWEKLGVDYFSFEYLLAVDYYSKYSKTAESTITVLKGLLARHGIPQEVVADNMPFNSRAFKVFANQWDFTEVLNTLNPMVLWNVMYRPLSTFCDEAGDKQMALLEFRNTPITGIDKSPAQLLMSRRLRASLPMTGTMLKPEVPENTRVKLDHRQQKQKRSYDKTTKLLPELKPGDVIRYQKGRLWMPAVVIGKHSTPRSYNIKTGNGNTLRRNRRHLRKTIEVPPPPPAPDLDDFVCEDNHSAATADGPSVDQPPVAPQPQVGRSTETRTRSGRIVRPPLRFRDN